MSLVKKFETQSARVKGVCFHPTRPWVITSLHSGLIQIWDYNMKIIIASFDQGEGPVRGVDFHPYLPLFVSGADSGHIRVWNYKQKRCLFILKGHIDYIRTTYFHHELPWILSACDDQTMRIWNYQSRLCVNIITGHSHYVMCAQFHPQKNLIVSASLDSTVRIWDYSILRKKLTETKNSTGFIGIEIQCIKILQGHERGCNWATFHPASNIIASGSDDRKIKLWKYTDQVAWEFSTILGHKNNVSSLLFDPVTHNLISNSEDKTLRIWNIETKTQILTQKKAKARFWIVAVNKNGSFLAAGHDQGLDIFQLNKKKILHAAISSELIIFSQGFNIYLYSVKDKKQVTELHQYKPKDKNAVAYIQKITGNPFENITYLCQIKENGQNERFYTVKKKQSYLNFSVISKEYSALDSCFIHQNQVAMLLSPLQIKLSGYTYKTPIEDRIIAVKEPFEIKRIFSSNKMNELIIVTGHNNRVSKLDVDKKKFLAHIEVEDINVRAIAFGYDRVAILSKFTIVVGSSELQKICVIKQKFPIKSVFWESQKILFYATINHLKYALMNGETGVLKTLDEPIHLLKKLEGNKFLSFNQRQKVFEIQFPDYTEIELKIAINERQVDKIKSILAKMGDSKKKILIKYLVQKGFPELGLNLVANSQQKFSLAVQSSNFQLAFELCNKVNTQQYWKMLGQQALKQGIYEAYELSCQKLKNFDQLNFLYSLQNNIDKLQKMMKIAKKTNNPILAFNTNLFLSNGDTYQQLLRESGLESLAELSREAFSQQVKKSDLLKRLKSKPLTPCQSVSGDNFANWPHNIEEDQKET